MAVDLGARQGGPTRGEDWFALTEGHPVPPDLAPVQRGIFVAEFTLPLEGPTVLLDCQQRGARPFTFALFHDARVGMVILHRSGATAVRHILRTTLPAEGTVRLTLRFDAGADTWDMRLDRLDGTLPFAARGTGVLPLCPAALNAIAGAARSPSLLWAGFRAGADLVTRQPWIGVRTPVDTPDGPVLACHLRAGDLVLTDRGPRPLLQVEHLRLPGRGSFAPMLLRAPFFAQRRDLLVSADQLIALSGVEVEYSFGDDEVLCPAGLLADHRAAVVDTRRAVIDGVALHFARPEVISADGCRLLIAPADARPPVRVLTPGEAMPLRASLGRGAQARVA